jgi:hypothetical protein
MHPGSSNSNHHAITICNVLTSVALWEPVHRAAVSIGAPIS